MLVAVIICLLVIFYENYALWAKILFSAQNEYGGGIQDGMCALFPV